MSVDQLHAVLQDGASKAYANETSFVVDIVPRFVRALDYDDSLLLFEYALGASLRYRADAVVVQPVSMKPWLLIEAKGPRFLLNRWREQTAEQMQMYRSVAEPEYALLIFPKQLWIYHGDTVVQYDLSKLTLEHAAEIFKRLSRPAAWPTPSATVPHKTSSAKSALTFEHFQSIRWC